MIELTNLTNEAKQSMILVGTNNEQIPFDLTYFPTQQLWSFNISYLDFEAKGITLVCAPNILYKFKNLLPFGIGVISTDGGDPYYIDDFIVKRIRIFLLDETDLENLNPLHEGTYEA